MGVRAFAQGGAELPGSHAMRQLAVEAAGLALAESMPPPFGQLVHDTTFGSLRWGEVTALRRMDVDLGAGTLHVRGAFVERSTRELIRGLPKSRASLRAVTLPRPLLELLPAHLAEHVAGDAEALIFTGDKGAALRRSNFNGTARWPAC